MPSYDPRYKVKGAAVKNYMDMNRDGPRSGRPPLKSELPRTQGPMRKIIPGFVVAWDNYSKIMWQGNMGDRPDGIVARAIDKTFGAGTWKKLQAGKVFEYGSPDYDWFMYSEYIPVKKFDWKELDNAMGITENKTYKKFIDELNNERK